MKFYHVIRWNVGSSAQGIKEIVRGETYAILINRGIHGLVVHMQSNPKEYKRQIEGIAGVENVTYSSRYSVLVLVGKAFSLEKIAEQIEKQLEI